MLFLSPKESLKKNKFLKIEFGGNFTVVECMRATNLSFFSDNDYCDTYVQYITTIPTEV